jgi:hypothetical protein
MIVDGDTDIDFVVPEIKEAKAKAMQDKMDLNVAADRVIKTIQADVRARGQVGKESDAVMRSNAALVDKAVKVIFFGQSRSGATMQGKEAIKQKPLSQKKLAEGSSSTEELTSLAVSDIIHDFDNSRFMNTVAWLKSKTPDKKAIVQLLDAIKAKFPGIEKRISRKNAAEIVLDSLIFSNDYSKGVRKEPQSIALLEVIMSEQKFGK